MKNTQPNFITLSLLLAIVLSTLNISRAETVVSGNVTGRWTRADSPYIISEQTNVPDGGELVIEPGVCVRSQHGDALTVNGRLIAIGTEQDSIHFQPVGWLPYWGGVRFLEADSGSALSYCVLQNGTRSFGSGRDTLSSGGNAALWQSDVEITHSLFLQGNAVLAGGGLVIYGGEQRIANCIFQGNSSYVGGGIACFDSCLTVFDSCRFVGNSATWGGGGGFITENSVPTFNDCHWIENRVDVGDEGSFGGALFIYNGADPVFVNCSFSENAACRGGAIYVRGFGSAPRFYWTDFISNAAEEPEGAGGAIYAYGGSPMLVNYCRLLDNRALLGGGIYICEQPRTAMRNVLFQSNVAQNNGGAIMLDGNIIDNWAIDRCTFVDNQQLNNDWNAYHTISSLAGASVALSSCIIMGAEPFYNPNLTDVSYSLVQGGVEGEGNLDEDPLFFGHDLSWRMLQSESPCIDTGDESLPNDPDGSRADMGWLSLPQTALADVDTTTVSVDILTGEEHVISVRVRNRSSLPFFASLKDVIPFDLVETINVSSITGDDELHGVAWCDDGYYISGEGAGFSPQIYHLDNDLRLTNQFAPPGNPDVGGYFDLASDGGEVLWGGDETHIVEFTTSGEFGEAFLRPDGLRDCRSLAMDELFSERFTDFYAGDTSGRIVLCGNDFRAVDSFQVEMNLTALAMRRNARSLYAIGEHEGYLDLMAVVPSKGSASRIARVELPDGYHPGGCEIARGLSASTDKLVGLLMGEAELGMPDLLFQSDLYSSWMGLAEETVLLKPWESVVWEIKVGGEGITPGDYAGAYQISVNGWGDPTVRNIQLHLTQNDVTERLLTPNDFALSAYPNPFNGQLRLNYNLPQSGAVEALILDSMGRRIASVCEGSVGSGEHSIGLDLTGLPSGKYYAHVKSNGWSKSIPITCIK